MRSHSADFAGASSEGLCPDLVPILRTVSRWADLHPLVSDVIIFGDRIRSGHAKRAVLHLAVCYDPDKLNEGFDDWIEQLRTDFADLRSWLGMPLDVTLPNHGQGWSLIGAGTDVADMARGKVRCVLTDPVSSHAPPITRTATQDQSVMTTVMRSLWCRLRDGLPFSLSPPFAAGRRPLP